MIASYCFQFNMLSEAASAPETRFLGVTAIFPDNALAAYPASISQVNQSRPKNELYRKYMNWQRSENEIAVLNLSPFLGPKSQVVKLRIGRFFISRRTVVKPDITQTAATGSPKGD
jgi:hypothetical protein